MFISPGLPGADEKYRFPFHRHLRDFYCINKVIFMLTNEDYLNIFHEIKNSISLIGGSLQLISKKHPEVQDFDYWNETMTEVDFLKNIVTQLSSARFCSRLNLMQVNIYVFMKQVCDSIRLISQKGFNCELVMKDSIPLVEIDSQLVKQAIINIIKNSYEAMGGKGTISIKVIFKNQLIHIAITDHGGGLDPALSENIFEPFITSKTGGSGLGLVITKQIIEAHHGSLTCDSRPGDGCTFTITLPLTQN